MEVKWTVREIRPELGELSREIKTTGAEHPDEREGDRLGGQVSTRVKTSDLSRDLDRSLKSWAVSICETPKLCAL
jgi:hypothetical protein